MPTVLLSGLAALLVTAATLWGAAEARVASHGSLPYLAQHLPAPPSEEQIALPDAGPHSSGLARWRSDQQVVAELPRERPLVLSLASHPLSESGTTSRPSRKAAPNPSRGPPSVLPS